MFITGVKLRSVKKTREMIEPKETTRSTVSHDLALILARRFAIELSDSENEEKSQDSDEGSECWVDVIDTSN